MIKLHEIDVFLINFCSGALKIITNSRTMKKKSNVKVFKVMKSTSKTNFSHYLLNNNYNDKF